MCTYMYVRVYDIHCFCICVYVYIVHCVQCTCILKCKLYCLHTPKVCHPWIWVIDIKKVSLYRWFGYTLLIVCIRSMCIYFYMYGCGYMGTYMYDMYVCIPHIYIVCICSLYVYVCLQLGKSYTVYSHIYISILLIMNTIPLSIV